MSRAAHWTTDVRRLVLLISATFALVALTLIVASPQASADSPQVAAPVAADPGSSLRGLVLWLLAGLVVMIAGVVLVNARTARVTGLPKMMHSFVDTRAALEGDGAVEAQLFETDAVETVAFETVAFETVAFETVAFETVAFETVAFETRVLDIAREPAGTSV